MMIYPAQILGHSENNLSINSAKWTNKRNDDDYYIKHCQECPGSIHSDVDMSKRERVFFDYKYVNLRVQFGVW